MKLNIALLPGCLLLFGFVFAASSTSAQDSSNDRHDTHEQRSFAAEIDRQETATEQRQEKVVNGIYLVQRWTIDRDDLFPLFDNEFFVQYDESKYLALQDDEPEPVKYIALSTVEFIPFELADDPDVKTRQDGRKLIGLTFSEGMSGKMKAFSRRYLGRQVATVVDGQILTLHKIRSVIDGGQLQISRCNDNGCELILSQLSKK